VAPNSAHYSVFSVHICTLTELVNISISETTSHLSGTTVPLLFSWSDDDSRHGCKWTERQTDHCLFCFWNWTMIQCLMPFTDASAQAFTHPQQFTVMQPSGTAITLSTSPSVYPSQHSPYVPPNEQGKLCNLKVDYRDRSICSMLHGVFVAWLIQECWGSKHCWNIISFSNVGTYPPWPWYPYPPLQPPVLGATPLPSHNVQQWGYPVTVPSGLGSVPHTYPQPFPHATAAVGSQAIPVPTNTTSVQLPMQIQAEHGKLQMLHEVYRFTVLNMYLPYSYTEKAEKEERYG